MPESEATEPEATESAMAQSGLTESRTAQSEATQSEATLSEATPSGTTQPGELEPANTETTTSTIWKRLLLFPLTRFVLSLLALWLGYLAHLIVSRLLSIPPLGREPIQVLAVVGAYLAYVRLIERRRARELAWRPALRETGLGLLVGGALVASIVLVIWAAGSYRVVALNGWTVAAAPLVTMVIVAVAEELMFRGILFRIMEEGLGTWIALILSAVLFGWVHLDNQNATVIGAVNIAATAGLLLAGVYLLTRRLWLAIGLHYAVNVMQGPILGLPVSGHPSTGLVESAMDGPELLTGGAFGIEASLLMSTFGVALAVYVLRAAHRQGRFVPPLWHPSRRNLAEGGILREMR